MAAKIDKKLAKKLAKMSEEDRAAFLEQMRVAEEEARRNKEEMLSRFLKDKLSKEEKATKVNLLRLRDQWRAIMRKSKTKELREDTEVMSQTFERVVDRKDAIIRSLATDLEEAEEQYQVALRSHLENLDELLDFQAKKVKNLEEGYRGQLETLRKEFDTERQTMVAHHEREMKDLEDVMYAAELRYTQREAEALQEFQSLMDDLKNKSLEDTHALSAQRKATLDELWEEFRRETDKYRENTEERKLRFEALKKKDEESARTIGRQMRRLQKLQDSIAQLKQKMAANSRESEEKIRGIKEDRKAVLSHFHELKQEMNTLRESERDSLTTLTLQSDAAMKELQRKKEKGERILRLAEMCRKLETEEEKVLPFFASSLSPEEEEEVTSVQAKPPSEALAQVMHEYAALENFWRRYNKVLLDRTALDREKQTLELENKKLKLLLKQYLDGISVNDEILSQTNPLFVVSSNATAPPLSVPVGDSRVQRRSQETVNVVEAAHVVKNTV